MFWVSSLFSVRPWLATLTILIAIDSQALAEMPCVYFDVPDVVSCRRLEDEAFQRDHPGEMLVEAVFDVSSLLRLGSEDALTQILFVIESPPRTLHVMDYEPKTQLATPLAGNVKVQNNAQKSAQLGLNATVTPDAIATANGNASIGNSSTTNLSYDLLPPKRLLAASGTIARGSAVYFKLKPSAQTSLEGARRFKILFRVPDTWRGDYVRLRCAAYDHIELDKQPICGSSDFLVGLYLLGDNSARETVSSLSRVDRHLRKLAVEKRRTVEKQRFPSISDKVGALFNVARPKIPHDWLRQSMGSESPLSFERYLPEEVRQALEEYRKRRLQVRGLYSASGSLAASL